VKIELRAATAVSRAPVSTSGALIELNAPLPATLAMFWNTEARFAAGAPFVPAPPTAPVRALLTFPASSAKLSGSTAGPVPANQVLTAFVTAALTEFRCDCAFARASFKVAVASAWKLRDIAMSASR